MGGTGGVSAGAHGRQPRAGSAVLLPQPCGHEIQDLPWCRGRGPTPLHPEFHDMQLLSAHRTPGEGTPSARRCRSHAQLSPRATSATGVGRTQHPEFSPLLHEVE